ncbi:MAG: asparagine synthase (glutamine-hydrolyzing) [Candidatus Rokubacteria bacterium]|nr:asparagine synthase (glutamine-hydrolyzing) [Candidatus Rokubacteria bacterium]
MCGICGVVRLRTPEQVDVTLLRRMRDAMRHRGPDDEGLFVDDNVGLGHRRLAIIDLASGHQPMASDDGRVRIVYNGEIYNFDNVRAELEAHGWTFRTKSDTEVILRAYEAFGPACVERLRGMFAFAIWDAGRRRLLLARDRLGIKPLYYTFAGASLLFASEIKALLHWPGVARELDPAALGQYLRLRYVPAPRTMFRGISKLPPGHVLLVERGAVTVRRYWDLPLDVEPVDEPGAAEELRDLLAECVRAHLVSDVPLGAFLSGGIDSTAVTGIMAGLLPDAVRTFTVGYPDGTGSDETAYARLAAERFHTEHRELILDRARFWEFLPRLVWFLDEPVADPAAVPLHFLSRFARDFVTVAISGEGADEALGGYAIYATMLRLEPLRRLPGIGLLRPLARGRRFARYLERAAHPIERSYRGVSAVFGEGEGERMLVPGLTAPDDEFAAACFDRTRHLDPLRRMLYFDLKVWLPDDLLVKADKMTMASSLELRVPFLDHRLVEWAWRVPSHLKVQGGRGKRVLGEAMRGLVPREIVERPKQGFTIPVREWFRTGLGEAARELFAGCPLLDRGTVEGLIARHARGREDLSEPLFTLAVLAAWHRVFIEARATEAPAVPGSRQDA